MRTEEYLSAAMFVASNAVLTFITAGAAITTITVTKYLQAATIASHEFAFARRVGIRGALKISWRRFRRADRHRRLRLVWAGSKHVGRVLGTGTAAFVILGITASAGLLPTVRSGAEHAGAANIVAVIAAISFMALHVGGLRPIARPGLPSRDNPIRLPDAASRTGHARVALNRFWHAVAPGMVFVACSAITLAVGAVWFMSPSECGCVHWLAAQRVAALPPNTVIALSAVNFIATWWIAMAIGNRLLRRSASITALVVITHIRTETTDTEGEDVDLMGVVSSGVPDSAKFLRPFVHLIDQLEDAADSLPAPAELAAPLPVATLLRASAAHLRRYLQSSAAIAPTLPDNIITTLDLTALVLAGPADRRVYDQLARHVGAFDEEGMPAVSPTAKSPGRIRRAATRTAIGLERSAKTVGDLKIVIALVVLAALVLANRIKLTELLGHLK